MKIMKHRLPILLFLALPMTLSACSKVSTIAAATALQPGQLPEAPARTIYVAVSVNSPKNRLMAEDLLYYLSRHLRSTDHIVIDELEGDHVVNLVSAPVTTEVIKESGTSLVDTPATDKAVVDSLNRAVHLQSSKAVILTDGITDTTELQNTATTVKRIGGESGVYLIGIDPILRLPMSQAFQNVRDRVRFASSEQETLTLLKEVVQ